MVPGETGGGHGFRQARWHARESERAPSPWPTGVARDKRLKYLALQAGRRLNRARAGGGQTVGDDAHEHNGRVGPVGGHLVSDGQLLHGCWSARGDSQGRCTDTLERRPLPDAPAPTGPATPRAWQARAGSSGAVHRGPAQPLSGSSAGCTPPLQPFFPPRGKRLFGFVPSSVAQRYVSSNEKRFMHEEYEWSTRVRERSMDFLSLIAPKSDASGCAPRARAPRGPVHRRDCPVVPCRFGGSPVGELTCAHPGSPVLHTGAAPSFRCHGAPRATPSPSVTRRARGANRARVLCLRALAHGVL
jgi:hypothetical protein